MLCSCVRLCVCVHVCAHVCVHVCTCACTCVSMSVHAGTCMCVYFTWMHICVKVGSPLQVTQQSEADARTCPSSLTVYHLTQSLSLNPDVSALGTGVTDVHCHTWLLCWRWRSEIMLTQQALYPLSWVQPLVLGSEVQLLTTCPSLPPFPVCPVAGISCPCFMINPSIP